MGKKGRKLLALFMVLAMVVTYSFSVSILSVYADDEQGEVNAKAKASEDATPAEPESTPEPTSEPDPPAPTEPSTPDPGQSGGDSSGTGSDTGGNTDADTGSESGDANDASSESDDVVADDNDSNAEGENNDSEAVTDENAVTGELIEGVTEEEEEEEVEYPEATRSVNVGGVTITVHAPEGALPEGFKVSAHSVGSQAVIGAVEQRIESEGKEFTGAAAFDIKTLTKDGETVQPKKSVTVTFSGTNISGGDIDVFHVSGDGSSVSEVGTSVASSNKQQFSASHFSIYVVAGGTESTVDPEEQGDGQTRKTRYILEYGDKVMLDSREGSFSSTWNVTSPSDYRTYIGVSGTTITNHNPSDGPVEITVRHRYRNWEYFGPIPYMGNQHDEFFYIIALPDKVDVTVMLQKAGEEGFSQYDSYELHKGDKATKPDCPSEDEQGNKLYGWYTDESCQTEFDFNSAVTSDLILYGKYTSETTITYFKNTDEAATVPEPLKGGAGTTVTLGSGSQAGFTFAGWNTDPSGNGDHYDGGQSILMPKEDLNLYAQWSDGSENKIIIRYHDNYSGGDDVYRSETNIRKNWQTTLWDATPTRPGTALIHFVFLGWSTNPRATAGAYFPGETFQTGEENVDLYAVWGTLSINSLKKLMVKSETVTYDGKEHSVSEVTYSDGSQVQYWSRNHNYVLVGDTALIGIPIYANIANLNKAGTNVGHYSTPVSAPLYYLAGGAMLRTIPLLNNRLLHLPVTPGVLTINPCEVTINTFDAEKMYDGTALTYKGEAVFTEGESEKAPTFDYEGGTITLVNGETLNIRTTGSQKDIGTSDNTYKFDWGKPDDWGSETSTAKKFNYSIKTGTIGKLTVYLDVAFDKNAGSDTVTGMPKNFKITDSKDMALPSDNPARDGYDFLGWAKDASATKADYQPGDKLTLDDFSGVGEDGLVLYAIWKAKDEPAPTPTPTPSGDDTPGEGGNGGGAGAGTTADNTVVDAADFVPEVIEDNATPEAATINDNPAPKSAPTSHWALLNLIAAILTIIGSLIAAFRKNSATTVVKGVGLAAAAAGVIVFLVTQNLGAPMQIADSWTILMAALFGVQCVTTGVTAKTPAVDD